MSRLQPAAKPMTDAEMGAKRELCFALHRNVVEALNGHKRTAVAAAKAMYEFDCEDAWRVLGYESLNHWLADPEVSWTRTTYGRYVAAYRDLVVTRKIPPAQLERVGIRKAVEVLPAIVAGKVSSKEALSDAEQMGFRDLRDEYRSYSTHVSEPEPEAESPEKPALSPVPEPVKASDVSRAGHITPDSGAVDDSFPDFEFERVDPEPGDLGPHWVVRGHVVKEIEDEEGRAWTEIEVRA